MAEYVLCQFPEEDARLLADLSGVEHDFRTARDFLDMIGPDVVNRKLDVVQIDALWTAAVIRYMRAFTSGVRTWPRDDFLRSLGAPERAWHDYFDDVRDKFVAHSVNDMETNMPTVSIRVDADGSKSVGGVTPGSSRVLGLSPDARAAMLNLIEKAAAQIAKLMDAEGKRLTELARGMDAETLYARGMVKHFGLPGGHDKARKFKAT